MENDEPKPTATPCNWPECRCATFCEAREGQIHADVFNPHETDLQYFQRRQRELGVKK